MSGWSLYIVAGAFASGIFVRSFFVSASVWVMPLVIISLALGCLWYTSGRRTSSLTFLFLLVCVSGALGILRTDIASSGERDALFDKRIDSEAEVVGTVVREADVRANSLLLTVRVDTLGGDKVDQLVLVRADRFPAYEYGDRVRIRGTLEIPEAFETDLGRTFNYPGYLSVRGISYTIADAQLERVSVDEGIFVLALLLDFKHAFMARIESLLPEPYAGLSEGLLLGVKRALGDDLEEVFRTTGIIHIVVLSGYNITIVAEAIMRLLSFFFAPRTRVICGVIAIIAFAFIAGLSATVVRASLMATLVLFARATGRRYDFARALTVAGLVMLVFNPKLLVFDPGFQLSFMATLALIVLAPLIEQRLSLVPTRFQMREFITAAIATQLFLLPLLVYSIGQISIVAVLTNALVLPAVPLAMLLSFLAGMVGFVSGALALPIAFCAYILLKYIIVAAEVSAMIPFASVPVPAFPFWVVVLAYMVMGYVLVRAFQRVSGGGDANENSARDEVPRAV